MKLTKQEIKNIIQKEWSERRARIKEQQAKRNELVKEWKARQAKGLNEPTGRFKKVKRTGPTVKRTGFIEDLVQRIKNRPSTEE